MTLEDDMKLKSIRCSATAAEPPLMSAEEMISASEISCEPLEGYLEAIIKETDCKTVVPMPVNGPPPIEALAGGRRTPPVILALDQGQRTGWAVRSRDGAIASGVQEFRPGRFEGGGMIWLRFRAWLQEIDETSGGVGVVVFEEERRHLGTAAAHAYGGYLAHLTAWAEANSIPYQGVPVGTIKRHIAGKGNADKAAVIAAVRALGFTPADDNEADALALLDWAIAKGVGGAR